MTIFKVIMGFVFLLVGLILLKPDIHIKKRMTWKKVGLGSGIGSIVGLFGWSLWGTIVIIMPQTWGIGLYLIHQVVIGSIGGGILGGLSKRKLNVKVDWPDITGFVFGTVLVVFGGMLILNVPIFGAALELF